MIKVGIMNQKGGVGKTSLTVNLAACLGEKWKRKVLICDCDAQANATTYLLTCAEEPDEADESANVSIYDVLNNGNIPKPQGIQIRNGKKLIKTGISLIPGDRRVDLIEEDRTSQLKEALDRLSGFDICFLDCSPQRTTINLIALGVCDYVLVPVFPDIDSVAGYDMVSELVSMLRKSGTNPTVEILGMIVNDVTQKGSLDSYLIEKFGREFGDIVFKSTIRHSLQVRQARYMGLPVNYFKGSSNVTADYYACAKEFLKKLGRK